MKTTQHNIGKKLSQEDEIKESTIKEIERTVIS